MANPLHATDDSFTFAEGGSYTGNLLNNDDAGSNGKIFLRNFDGITVQAKQANQETTIAGDYGVFTVKANGEFTYKLNAEYSSLAKGQTLTENVSYKISDGLGNTDYALAKFNIVGTKPLAVDDTFTFNEDAAISGNVLANDVPGSNGKLFLRSVEGTGIDAKNGLTQTTDVKGDYGTFHFSADGHFTYDLDASAADSIGAGQSLTETLQYYKISDGLGHTDVGVVTLTIDGVGEGTALV